MLQNNWIIVFNQQLITSNFVLFTIIWDSSLFFNFCRFLLKPKAAPVILREVYYLPTRAKSILLAQSPALLVRAWKALVVAKPVKDIFPATLTPQCLHPHASHSVLSLHRGWNVQAFRLLKNYNWMSALLKVTNSQNFTVLLANCRL